MTYAWQKFWEDKLREIVKEPSVLDIGGGEPFQKMLAPYKKWFEGVEYKTLDSEEKYNPTVVGDAHNLPLADGTEDAIICKSVLEHLYDPKKAVEEMWRVLKPGGKALVYTHFIYPYHARKGVYKDYFRFTGEGLEYLFRDFSKIEIQKHGGYFTALFFFIPLHYKLRWFLDPLANVLDKAFKTEKRNTTAGYFVYVEK